MKDGDLKSYGEVLVASRKIIGFRRKYMAGSKNSIRGKTECTTLYLSEVHIINCLRRIKRRHIVV